MIKSIFFDFDGTIADTFAFTLNIAEQVLKQNKILHGFDISKIEYYRNLTVSQFLKELKIPFYKLPHLGLQFRKKNERKY